MFSIWTWVLQWTKALADSGPHRLLCGVFWKILWRSSKDGITLVVPAESYFPLKQNTYFSNFSKMENCWGKTETNVSWVNCSMSPYWSIHVQPLCLMHEVFDFNLKLYIVFNIVMMALKRISHKIISFKRKPACVWSSPSAPSCPLCQAVKVGSIKWQ